MTAAPAERDSGYEVDHQREFIWGRLTVSAGAVAVFDLRPVVIEGPQARDLLTVESGVAIAHPPLNITLTTSAEIGEAFVGAGLMTGVTGGPDDEEWSLRFWSDSPPFDRTPDTGRLVAHNLALVTGETVAGQLPHLLRQEGMSPMPLAEAERYAVALGTGVRNDVHAVYCVEAHDWPPLVPGAA